MGKETPARDATPPRTYKDTILHRITSTEVSHPRNLRDTREGTNEMIETIGINLLFEDPKRPDSVFEDGTGKEDPLPMDGRDALDLEKKKTLNSPWVKMERHHMLPWAGTLREFWNSTVLEYYRTPDVKLDKEVAGGLEGIKYVIDKYPTKRIGNKNGLKTFVDLLKDGGIYHDPNSNNSGYNDVKEELRGIICWLPANLIIGPDKQDKSDKTKAFRVDDPYEYFEKYLIESMTNSANKKSILAMRDAWRLYSPPPADSSTWKETESNRNYLREFWKGYEILCRGETFYPQMITNAAWSRIEPKESYIPGDPYDRLETMPKPPKAGWPSNNFLYPLRQAASRPKFTRQLPSESATPNRSKHVQLDDGDCITIGGQSICLDLTFTTDDGTQGLIGRAGNISVGALLQYLTQQWPGKNLQIPDYLSSLTAIGLRVDHIYGPAVETYWRFSAALQTSFAGSLVDISLEIENLDDEFSLSAYLGIWNQESDSDPVYFDGSFTKSSDGWRISASLNSPENPLKLTDIASAFGIDMAAVPDDLKQLLPELSEASFVYQSGAKNVMAVTFRTSHFQGAIVKLDSGVWAVEGGVTLDFALSDLPLVGGGVPPKYDAVLSGVGLLWVSSGLTKDQVVQINTELLSIDDSLPRFPYPPEGDSFSGSAIYLTASIKDNDVSDSLALPLQR